MNNQTFPLLDSVAGEKLTAISQKKPSVTDDKGFSKAFNEVTDKTADVKKPENMRSEQEVDVSTTNKVSAKKELTKTESVLEQASIEDKSGDSSDLSHAIGNIDEATIDIAIQSEYSPSGINAFTPEQNVSNDSLSLESDEPITLAELQSLLNVITAKLQELAANGGIDAIESSIQPEVVQELAAQLLPDGNSLPLTSSLEPVVASIREALSTQSAITAGVANNFLTDLKRNASLTPLAEALTAKLGQIESSVLNSVVVANTNTQQLSSNNLLLPQSGQLTSVTTDTLGQLDLGPLSMEKAFNRINKESVETVTLPRLTAELSGVTGQNAPLLAPGQKAQLMVATPFQQAQWGQAVAERVMWMSSQGLQEAEIHLDPPELGPMQVRVSVANDQAHVSFVVQHSTVREALDQNAMRLREMFDGEGINLADVDVSDQSQQQSSDKSDDEGQSTLGSTSTAEDAQVSESQLSINSDGYSLLNIYA